MVKFPGSVHDVFIVNKSELSYHLENTGVDGWLLGDSVYPLKKFLMTPKLNPSAFAEQRYNRAHSKTRVVVERAFGVCKSGFIKGETIRHIRNTNNGDDLHDIISNFRKRLIDRGYRESEIDKKHIYSTE